MKKMLLLIGALLSTTAFADITNNGPQLSCPSPHDGQNPILNADRTQWTYTDSVNNITWKSAVFSTPFASGTTLHGNFYAQINYKGEVTCQYQAVYQHDSTTVVMTSDVGHVTINQSEQNWATIYDVQTGHLDWAGCLRNWNSTPISTCYFYKAQD
jgi:hypothetical protein